MLDWFGLVCFANKNTKIVICHTADSKPVKQEVNGTMILPPLVLPGFDYCYTPPHPPTPHTHIYIWHCSCTRLMCLKASQLIMPKQEYTLYQRCFVDLRKSKYNLKSSQDNLKQGNLFKTDLNPHGPTKVKEQGHNCIKHLRPQFTNAHNKLECWS